MNIIYMQNAVYLLKQCASLKVLPIKSSQLEQFKSASKTAEITITFVAAYQKLMQTVIMYILYIFITWSNEQVTDIC